MHWSAGVESAKPVSTTPRKNHPRGGGGETESLANPLLVVVDKSRSKEYDGTLESFYYRRKYHGRGKRDFSGTTVCLVAV